MWREIKQTTADAQFWKERTLAAESGGLGPQGLGWFCHPLPMQSWQPPIPSLPPPGKFGTPGGYVKLAETLIIPNHFFPPECGIGRGRRDDYMQNVTADSTDRVDPDTCRLCRGRGRWAKDCLNREMTFTVETQTNACMIKAGGDNASGPRWSGGMPSAQPQDNGGQRRAFADNKTYLCVSLTTMGKITV